NQQFAEYALKVTLRREHFIKELETLAQPIHAGITNHRETLTLDYVPSLKLSNYEANQFELIEEVLALLNDNLQREKERGVCLYGPHRDDLSFNVNGMDAQMNIEVGEYPILLLDDVLSELDDSRQTHLLSTIQHKVQTFVTTTSVEGIDHEIMNNAKLY
ncbi:MAG: DNA replication and repair protein RecF, partial [Staphylococcus epidermidis]|nr:DNA replication and repair protein RecF [Staphylococcus epidermidis]